MKKVPGKWLFESRDDVLREIIDGRDARHLLACECPKCHHIKVLFYSERYMPFASTDYMELPAGVSVSVEEGMRGQVPPTQLCPKDGSVMRWIESEVSASLLRPRG